MNAATRQIHTAIVGAGQAGLCMSHHLSRRGIDHLVLERARIGERWRSERWNSLHFQFPNRYVRLPGFDYRGAEPDAFMPAAGIVSVLERYASHIEAPVLCGVDVRAVEASEYGFLLDTPRFSLECRNLVLATGAYQRTRIPALSLALPNTLRQLTASSYTSAEALPDGAVLVVGAGGSGVQIAEDLLAAGRDTWLCVSRHRRIPRRYRGRDIMDWMEDLGLTRQAVEGAPVDPAPLLTGVAGGYEVDLRRLSSAGGHLLGHLEAVAGDELRLGNELHAHIAAGDAARDAIVAGIDALIAERGIEAPAAEPDTPAAPLPPESPAVLSLTDAGIRSVIWATGYSADFSWLRCGAFNSDGTPVHERGVTRTPGLYVLGLPFLHNARSSFFWGVGEDADYLAEHLSRR